MALCTAKRSIFGGLIISSMDNFHYKNGRLLCEDIEVDAIIEEHGTPCYIYSKETLTQHYNRFVQAFSELNPKAAFSMKSCNNISLLNVLIKLGAHIDIVSGGELYKAIKAGIDPKKVVFAGVGKSDAELEMAVENGIKYINVESAQELEILSKVAENKSKTASVVIRVNPDVFDDKTHVKTTTGNKTSKFGISYADVKGLFEAYIENPNVNIVGLHVHLGSPIYSPKPYVQAVAKIKELINSIHEKFPSCIRSLNIGGGFPADYRGGDHLSWEEYAEKIVPTLRELIQQGIEIVMEPGRTISANSGVFACDVLYRKTAGDRQYLILNGGMSHFIRPAMYDSEHFIAPTLLKNNITSPANDQCLKNLELTDFSIAGPICESSDVLAESKPLPADTGRGNRLVFFSAGAYGMVMASNYNAVPRAPEIMVDGSNSHLIRERETFDDLCNKEILIDL